MQRFTSEVDGERIDVKKNGSPTATYHIDVTVVVDGEEMGGGMALSRLPSGDIDGTRDLSADLCARLVAEALDHLDAPLGSLLTASIERRHAVRKMYGPSRGEWDWVAEREGEDVYDHEAALRAKRSREANE